MKVAFIVSSLKNVGVISLVKDLSNELLNIGVVCKIFYFDKIKELEFNCDIERISIYRRFNFNDYDIIHSHSLRPNAYVFLHRRKSDRAKFVTTLHSYIKQDLTHTYNKLISLIFFKIWNTLLIRQDCIVVLSKDASRYYQNLLFNRNIKYIYSGRNILKQNMEVDESDKELLTSLKENYTIIGSNAVLTSIKGLEQIISFISTDPNYAYVIVGNGKALKSLKSFAQKLNVSDRCFFIGYRLNAMRYINYYDIYAMPSKSEGFPLALVEAIAYMKPAVVSNLNIFNELYSDDEVVKFKLNDLASLSSSIYKLQNKQYYSLIVNSALIKYKEQYTAKAMAIRYFKLYEELLRSDILS